MALALLAIIGLVGCRKDVDIAEHRKDYVLVGVRASDVVITDLVPDLLVAAPRNQTGIHEIDLDNDQHNDIRLKTWTNYAGGGMTLVGARVHIETLNSSTFLQTNGTDVNPLVYGDTLSLNDFWMPGSFLLVGYSGSFTSPTPGTSTGNWYMVTDSYIGVKCNDRFGWVKLDPRSWSITVYEYAFQR